MMCKQMLSWTEERSFLEVPFTQRSNYASVPPERARLACTVNIYSTTDCDGGTRFCCILSTAHFQPDSLVSTLVERCPWNYMQLWCKQSVYSRNSWKAFQTINWQPLHSPPQSWDSSGIAVHLICHIQDSGNSRKCYELYSFMNGT